MRGDGLVLNESTGSSPGSPEGGSSRRSTVDRVVLGIWTFYANLLFFPQELGRKDFGSEGSWWRKCRGFESKKYEMVL